MRQADDGASPKDAAPPPREPRPAERLPAPQKKKDKQAIEDLLRTLGCAGGLGDARRLLDKSLRFVDKSLTLVDKSGKDQLVQVVVPVYMTLLVKKLVAARDEDDSINLVGTLIQRPLLYDLKKLQPVSGKEAKPYFDMRLNEG